MSDKVLSPQVDLRIQTELREAVEHYIGRGYRLVSRDPMLLFTDDDIVMIEGNNSVHHFYKRSGVSYNQEFIDAMEERKQAILAVRKGLDRRRDAAGEKR